MSKSPFKTAIAVANNLVGTSLFVAPVAFLNQGIIQNTVAAVSLYFIKGYHGYCHGKHCCCHRNSCIWTAQIVLSGC